MARQRHRPSIRLSFGRFLVILSAAKNLGLKVCRDASPLLSMTRRRLGRSLALQPLVALSGAKG
ncbi:MAG: hypothetical protein RMM06_03190, partial [Armatimonadota bacterium]|nr:hypothetical protein [Armatimonadota bacterium]